MTAAVVSSHIQSGNYSVAQCILAKYWDFKYTFLLLIFITYGVTEVWASDWQENCMFGWHCFFFRISILCYLKEYCLAVCFLSHLYMKSHISFSFAAWVIMVKEIVKWNVHIAVLLLLLLQSVNIMLKIKLRVYIYNVIVFEYRKLKGIGLRVPLMVYVHIKWCENYLVWKLWKPMQTTWESHMTVTLNGICLYFVKTGWVENCGANADDTVSHKTVFFLQDRK